MISVRWHRLQRPSLADYVTGMGAVASAPASESGRLCHGDGGHEGGARRRRVLELPTLTLLLLRPLRGAGYVLGNIADTPMAELVGSERQRAFGAAKRDTLPRYCRECPVRFACHGECPKNRFILTPDGEPGLNYLCAGYKAFFTHIDKPMRLMADLLRRGRYADEVMQPLYGARYWLKTTLASGPPRLTQLGTTVLLTASLTAAAMAGLVGIHSIPFARLHSTPSAVVLRPISQPRSRNSSPSLVRVALSSGEIRSQVRLLTTKVPVTGPWLTSTRYLVTSNHFTPQPE